MAYFDQTNERRRAVAITAVAALHAGAIYALVTGLGAQYIREVMPVFEARNIPVEVPPPAPQPAAQPQDQPVLQAPRPMLDVPRPRDAVLVDPMPLPMPIPLPQPGPSADPLPPPQPVPSFAPRRAAPKGRPGDWVTTNDYPARDLREGNQGTTRFSLLIGSDGRVDSCLVTASSGFAGLDEATCRNVSRRARFDAASDENGARVAGTYSGTIRWVIPQD